MDGIQYFTNDDLGTVRTLEFNGIIYFVAVDVARILGYTNPQKAVRDHVDEEDRTLNEMFTVNGTKGILINESGLYSLILSSKLPNAKDFKRWITSEVLPALRQSGFYSLVGTSDDRFADCETPTRILNSDDYLAAARLVATCKKERLPLVLNLLAKGGWDVVDPQELVQSGVTNTSDAGRRIKETMQQTNTTVAQLAEAIGFNRVTLTYYLEGKRFPRPERYAMLINALDEFRREHTEVKENG